MKRKASSVDKPARKQQKRQTFERISKFDEKKEINVTSAPLVAAQTTASLNLLNPCAQGNTAVTRAGRRTTMTSLEYKFQGSLAATTAGSSPIRLSIIYDKQPNGAPPATTDVFFANTIDSMMNLNNSRRFKVLVDHVIEQGLSDKGPGAFMIKGHRDFTKGKRRGLECEFKNTSAGDITDITTGSIYSFVWQNGNLITANPTNDLFTRIRFIDP